ncbi:GHKL domain-containing protein [Patescibacteria group bacterium]|nr:GHKL domain-containing protein [Patescibacteria group bacterium]
MSNRKIYPVSKVDSKDTKIELNCRPVKSILLYFEERYGQKKLEEFIYNTKMNLEYLENRDNWVSYGYFCRLLAKLVEYAGDPKAPFIAGMYAVKDGCYGTFENINRRFGTPGTTYKLITEFTPRYSKIDTFEIANLKRNNCTIIIKMSNGYKQDKNNCLNLQGIFVSIPTFWNLPPAKVKEIQCAAEGADSCVYEISWRNRPSHLFGLLGILTGLIVLVGINTFLWRPENISILIVFPILGYLIGRIKDHKITLKDNVDIRERESKDLLESIETIEKLNMELQEKVERRTEELQKALDELKNSQNQLIQSEKMASVGRLAAGMAHELNNPVGAVRNYIQDVLEDIPKDDSRWERLKMAEKATGRCKRIVSDLLTFARETKELVVVDVNDIIETTILNAREEILNPNIGIVKELAPDLPQVKADSMQLQQVFMNLIMNAGDAVKGEGQIIIKTSSASGNVIIEISDTGKGVPEDIQDKIFDPFFTTKGSRKGIGLGLAISYNIIKRFNGDIQVKSEKDKGATFTIILPIENKTAGSVQDLGQSK